MEPAARTRNNEKNDNTSRQRRTTRHIRPDSRTLLPQRNTQPNEHTVTNTIQQPLEKPSSTTTGEFLLQQKTLYSPTRRQKQTDSQTLTEIEKSPENSHNGRNRHMSEKISPSNYPHPVENPSPPDPATTKRTPEYTHAPAHQESPTAAGNSYPQTEKDR